MVFHLAYHKFPQEFFEGIFLGREVFLELGHFDKHSPATREEKTPQGKKNLFFPWKLLKV